MLRFFSHINVGIGMNKLLFIILTASFALAACAPPIGHINSSENTIYDDFWIVSRRSNYNRGDDFNRISDLWAFASHRGVVEIISSDKLEIELITNPDDAVSNDPIKMADDIYTLSTNVGIGRKLVIVSYGDKTADYSIQIMDPYGLGGGGDPNGGGTGIGVIWR